jgi:uncharacterized membrane protein YccF (DUF307 family)
VTNTSQHSLLVRAVWFVFVGWWLSGLWLSVAWVLNVTVIGIPLGIKMINRVPYVVSLKKRDDLQVVTQSAGGVEVSHQRPNQHALWVRAIYFVLVGWWFSGVWMFVAWLFTLPLVTLPLAVWMYDRLPFVVSLYRLEQ